MRFLVHFLLCLSSLQLHAQKPEPGTYVVCSFPKEGKPQYNLMLTLHQDSFELAMYEMPASERYFIPFSRTTKEQRQNARKAAIKETIRGTWTSTRREPIKHAWYKDDGVHYDFTLRAADGRKQAFDAVKWIDDRVVIIFGEAGFVFSEPNVMRGTMMFCRNY